MTTEYAAESAVTGILRNNRYVYIPGLGCLAGLKEYVHNQSWTHALKPHQCHNGMPTLTHPHIFTPLFFLIIIGLILVIMIIINIICTFSID